MDSWVDLRTFRYEVLSAYGASASEIEELLAYSDSGFTPDRVSQFIDISQRQEPFINSWKQYIAEAAEQGVFQTLKAHLPQLQFPIQAGISELEAYRSVTRRGQRPADPALATGLILKQPERLQLWLHQTVVGEIPILVASDRQDFVCLVQAFTLKNEPKPIPDSMGACIISGFNNWDRIYHYRQQWESQNPLACSPAHWSLEFQRILPQKELYQDRFIILSEGPYSHVLAQDLGLLDDTWLQLSLIIRLEHECTHYLTRRLFGSMRNHIFDELLADYCGIVAAIGTYRADWFLRFVGLESYPVYREGGRLQNYRGDLLSEGAFKVLQSLVKGAAENLEQFHSQYHDQLQDQTSQLQLLIALMQLTVEELAAEKATDRLKETFEISRQFLVNY